MPFTILQRTLLQRSSYLVFLTGKTAKLHITRRLFSTNACVSIDTSVSTQRKPQSAEPQESEKWKDPRRYSVTDFPDLAADKETKKRLRPLLRQHKLRLRHGLLAPLELTRENLLDLLALPSHNRRCRYFEYLSHKENKRLKQLRREAGVTAPAASEPKQPRPPFVPHTADYTDEYRLFGNCFLIRLQETAMLTFYESRQIPAVMFGQSLVFDLAYDDQMTPRECNKAAVDLRAAYGRNRLNRDPFHLHFCNANPRHRTTQLLRDTLFGLAKHTTLSEVTERSYLELFPKENLVYLTPDGKETMNVFDHDAVYVIGVLVDKDTKEGATFAKAQREGVRTMRFPHTFTLEWEKDKAKALHLTDVIKILLALKRTNDWAHALKYIHPKLNVS
ncbi:unnamed protein product [Ixodes hexagonus]